MPDLPPWALALQIPLVIAVAWYFDREHRKQQAEHQAELKRRTDTLTSQINDWRTLYSQERADRLAADARLASAVREIKDAADRVDELTKEVIRHGPRNGPRA